VGLTTGAGVVAHLGELDREALEARRVEHEGLGILRGLDEILGEMNREAGDLRQVLRALLGVARRCIEAVPIAVAPMLTSCRTRWTRSRASSSSLSVLAIALNSWPNVMGTASCSCVRPILRRFENSVALAANGRDQLLERGDELHVAERHPDVHGRGIEVVRGLRLVQVIVRVAVLVFAFLCPMSSSARLAITSFAAMLVEVPAPPWNTSRLNWSWSFRP
jgi:hypothetical protein